MAGDHCVAFLLIEYAIFNLQRTDQKSSPFYRCSWFYGLSIRKAAKSRHFSPRLRQLCYLRRRWDRYPAGTTFAGPGLAPAGTLRLGTAPLGWRVRVVGDGRPPFCGPGTAES